MKIELPLETWTELFGFVPRSQLKRLIPHIGEKRKRKRGGKRQQTIGDRQFVSFVQFFFHKFGEVTLGELHVKWPIDEDVPLAINGYGEEQITLSRNGPIVIVNGEDRLLLAHMLPIPENAKTFESIVISYYDASVIAFIQKFEQKSLLTNVNLTFDICTNFLLQIMTNLPPLFTNINSIKINSSHVLDEIQSEYSELAISMLTSARVLITGYNCRDIWYSDWLHIPRKDGKPRILFIYGYNSGGFFSMSHFIKHIKKNFTYLNFSTGLLEGKQAVCFFIELQKFRDADDIQNITLENDQTHEKLVFKTSNQNNKTIMRYPMDINIDWDEEMSQYHIHNKETEFIEEIGEYRNIQKRRITFEA